MVTTVLGIEHFGACPELNLIFAEYMGIMFYHLQFPIWTTWGAEEKERAIAMQDSIISFEQSPALMIQFFSTARMHESFYKLLCTTLCPTFVINYSKDDQISGSNWGLYDEILVIKLVGWGENWRVGDCE